MKYYAALTCTVVFFILLSSNVGDATNSTWGRRGPYDSLIHREFVVKGSHWLQVVTRDVIYPAKGHQSFYNITFINAIDWDRKNGGYASLVKGGIGKRNCTVNLRSQRSYGLNFTVEIYGH